MRRAVCYRNSTKCSVDLLASNRPTIQPSNPPTILPSYHPTIQPSKPPTIPTSKPPTIQPSNNPTIQPSNYPTLEVSNYSTIQPSNYLTFFRNFRGRLFFFTSLSVTKLFVYYFSITVRLGSPLSQHYYFSLYPLLPLTIGFNGGSVSFLNTKSKKKAYGPPQFCTSKPAVHLC